MDIRSQYYISALAECRSVSKAARQLGISQPALSSWLNRIEAELGTELVIRSHKNLILTPAGKVYLEASEKMIQLAEHCIQDVIRLSGATKETILIGGTPNGGARVFSRIYNSMRSSFPQVDLRFVECYNREMFDMISKGTLDIGIGSSTDLEQKNIEYITTGSREIILLIPEGLPGYYDASSFRPDTEFPVIDLNTIKDIPLIMPSEEMSYSHKLREYFAENGYEPNIIFTSGNVQILYQMLKNKNGAAILARNYFSTLDHTAPYSFSPRIISYSTTVYKKGKELSEAEKAFIQYNSRLLGG